MKDELLVAESRENTFMDDFSLDVGVNRVFGLSDVERREAVDGDLLQHLQRVRPGEPVLPQERPAPDIAGLLPRHALVQPVGVLLEPEPAPGIPLGRPAHAIYRQSHDALVVLRVGMKYRIIYLNLSSASYCEQAPMTLSICEYRQPVLGQST